MVTYALTAILPNILIGQ